MSVYVVNEIVGTSEKSWKAAKVAIENASKSVKDLVLLKCEQDEQ
jgi:flavin-binding protein dodecin